MNKKRETIGIAAIFKNEAPYILEWIAHHRLLGINKFFIADNDSTDQTRTILKKLAASGIVSWIPWPSTPDEKPQIQAYRSLVAKFGYSVEWMAFIDADEYIWATSDQHLVDFLNCMQPSVGAIALNWATYGSSDRYYYTNESTPDRFIWHAAMKSPDNHNFKTIARTSAIQDFTCPHNVIINQQNRYTHTNGTLKHTPASSGLTNQFAHCKSKGVHWDHFRINHYIIRSWEEYAVKKSKRGRAYSHSTLDDLYFWGHDFHDEKTLPAKHYTNSLQNEIKKLESLIDQDVLNEVCSVFGSQNVPPAPILGNIDSVKIDSSTITITGWALEWSRYRIQCCKILINDKENTADVCIHHTPRPDVREHHKDADTICGFIISTQTSTPEQIKSIAIQSMSNGSEIFKPITWKANTASLLSIGEQL